MTETYTPKVGDRVRLTFEGTVGCTEPGGFRVDDGGYGPWFDVPEPVWVNGDVIQRFDFSPIVRVGDKWRLIHNGDDQAVSDETVTRTWDNGNVTILYKHDAA